MADLVVGAGETLVIDPTYPLLPQYDLFRMENNSTIVASVHLVIKARRAEFGQNCVIEAKGHPGPDGATPPNAPMGMDGYPGQHGTGGGDAYSVTIEAGLSGAGDLTIVTSGGNGGRGGNGGMAGGAVLPDSPRGGAGGPGGPGGNGGTITTVWTAYARGLHTDADPVPTGHQYQSSGGDGGGGGAGGQGALPGIPGAPGTSGDAGSITVEWIERVYGNRLWVQKQDIGPVARFNAAMARDPSRDRIVLFGGEIEGASEAFGDTWEWDGKLWTQVQDTGPSPRASHAMTFDPVTQNILLFGGALAPADTWLWDGENWVQVADTGPAPRYAVALATDHNTNRVLLFGGQSTDLNAGMLFGDTWEWDGAEWTQLEDAGPPSRMGARMAYDISDGTLVLFGGMNTSGRLADTWRWNGNAWTQTNDTGPTARSGHAMSSDGAGVVLFGGQVRDGDSEPGDRGVAGDTWVFSQQLWRQVQDMGPSARSLAAMAYDEQRDSVILFGGWDTSGSPRRDTWYFAERG